MGLKDKASKIDFGAIPGAVAPAPAADATHRPRTAPGMMMAHSADQRSELLRENEALKQQVGELGQSAARVAQLQDELKVWDGAKATRLIDPKLVVRSRWANRDAAHFQTPEFEQLKAEIASAGGNVQPVKVRPLPASAGGEGARYELVYGHRRFEACQQLGLSVLALVDNLDDRSLFVEMDRENRSRQDLSAWEQGVMYRRALEEGLFTSNRKLADAVGADLTNVGRALALASLPREVVKAFVSPLDLQYRWAGPLRNALEADEAGVRAKAVQIAEMPKRLDSKRVFELLTATVEEGGGTVLPPAVELRKDGSKVGLLAVDRRGAVSLSLAPGAMEAGQLRGLADLVERFLSKTSASN